MLKQSESPSMALATTGLLTDPIVMVGAERSGTILTMVIFDHHPQIAFLDCYYAIEKLPDWGGWPDLDEYYAYLETDLVFQTYGFTIDKSLDYPHLVDSFVKQGIARSGKPVLMVKIRDHFPRVLRVWPDARFLHILRDGRDVSRSIIDMGWAGNMYTASEVWLRAETLWDEVRQVVPADRLAEFRYEDLVSDPEATLSRICEFIGVPYDARMLDYPKDSTYGPPSPKHIGQWKRKLPVDAVRLAEARIGVMLAARGYELSGYPPLKVTPWMEKRLRLQSRWYCAMFRRRHYGTGLYLANLLARRIGTRAWQKRLASETNRIDMEYLK